MTFRDEVTTRLVLALCAIGVLWTATAFFGFAVFTLLEAPLGAASAAASTGGILIVILAIGWLVSVLRSRSPATPLAASSAPRTESGDLTTALAKLAADHPLAAVCCAALLGAANTLQSDNRK